MITRRSMMVAGASLLATGKSLLDSAVAATAAATTQATSPAGSYLPVETPNGSTLPFTLDGAVKVFHLTAEPVKREFTPGLNVNCWGYNGQTPGPTIEAVEGDRVRILVTNKLPAATSVHWHGLLIPNGMDGVAGLTQPKIEPGETVAYEFTLRQSGTQMYHPHQDEMTQIALGMFGFFVIHPKQPRTPAVDRDFCIFLSEWAIPPGTYTPNPNVMLDFNYFTFNSRVWPGTTPLVARLGQRVRIRFANLSMDSHPMHFHGHRFWVTGTDGGPIPESAWYPETTINVPVGTTRDIEFVADNPGDWPLHCHKTHHTMNGMGHDVPNMLGVSLGPAETAVKNLVPGYMEMGSAGMGNMHHMHGPENTVPMMSGEGPFGEIEMGGMFTIVKIREGITSYDDPGWYKHPTGTTAWKVK